MTSERRPEDGGGGKIMMVDTEEMASHPGEGSPLLGSSARQESPRDRASDGWDGYADFEHLSWWRRPSVYWLIGPYFLFTLAFGGVIVPKLNLIVDLVCRRYFADQTLKDPTFMFYPVILGGDNPQCNIAAVQKSTATFTLTLSILTGFLSGFTAPKLGSLSDRYGRTRLLCIASCGGVVNEVVTILAAKYPDVIDYHWLILGSFFDGITGSFTAGSILGSSYTADCSPPSKRGVYIGYLHACLFTGLAVGPLLAGYFIKWTGSLLSIFYVTLGCHIFFIIFLFFVTPESLSKKRQMIARDKHQIEQDAVTETIRAQLSNAPGFVSRHFGDTIPALLSANPLAPLKILVPAGRENRLVRRNLVILAVLDAVMLAAAFGSGTVTILYVEYIFGWGNFEASRFVSLVSFIRVFVLLGLFPLITYWFRLRPMARRRRESGITVSEKNVGADEVDVWLLRLAFLSDLIGILGYVFVRKEEFFVCFGAITAFGGLGGAVIQSSISKHVSAERVGSLLGAIGLLHALGRVFAPLLFNGIYAATVETYPQAFFVLLSSIFGLALLASMFVRPHLYVKDDDSYDSRPSSDTEAESSALSDEETIAREEIATESLPRV